jgi:AraC-like DNA-binding protein
MFESAYSGGGVFERFNIVTNHVESPKPTGPRGKLVLSSLQSGETRLAARTASIKFVLEGEEEYEVDGRRYVVDRDRFLLIDAGADCAARIRRSNHNHGMCVYFPVEAFEGLNFGRTLVMATGLEGLGQFMTSQASRLWRDPSLGPEIADTVVTTAARLANAARALAEARMARLGAVKPATRRDLIERLERARAYLHENPDRPVAQARLAKVAGLSQFHLARQFRDAFGDSPGAYHRRVRLESAERLLNAGLTLDAAAERTGYSDGSALGHALRRARHL